MLDLHICGGRKRLRVAEALLFSFFFLAVLAMSAGPAGAIAQQRAQGMQSLIISDMPQDDPCRALLLAVSYTSKAGAAVSAARREDAGGRAAKARAVAALGLALGAHYALGPRENASSAMRALSVSQGGGTPALAISAWRQCRNEQALRTRMP